MGKVKGLGVERRIDPNAGITDAIMVAEPERWPAYPLLPLRRDKEPSPEDRYPWDAGLLFDNNWSGGAITVYLVNMYMFTPSEREKYPTEVFDDVAALLEAGWKVD